MKKGEWRDAVSRRAVIESLDHIDPALGAFIYLDRDSVLRQAAQVRGGRLSGMLIAVKDLIDTANMTTTYGSRFFADHVPVKSAAIIETLEAEGAIVVGKTNLNEFAYGVTGYNPHYGAALSPRDPSRTAGGSSSGSAVAVASGVCRVAIATDTGGSARIPAACCGVYGFKCARAAYDMAGVFPLAESYDCLGFIAAGVEDLQAVLGIDELPDVRHLRVGVVAEDLQVPPLPDEHWVAFRRDVSRVHAARFASEPDRYGRDLQRKLRQEVGDVDRAMAVLANWSATFLAAVEGYDVLMGPALDGDAPQLSDVLADYENDTFVVSSRLLRHTPTYNELGWPALVVPTRDGARQLAARPGAEAALLAVGARIGLASQDVLG